MFVRTYIRTLFNDIFKKNILVKTISKIVNFYCELVFKTPEPIKFTQNLSIKDMEEKKTIIFQSFTGDKIDCK
jgi:hypothetical protein